MFAKATYLISASIILSLSDVMAHPLAVPLQDHIVHPNHGSSYQNINYADALSSSHSMPIDPFKRTNFIPKPQIPSEAFHIAEQYNSRKPISPDTYNLDEEIPKLPHLNDKLVENKYKSDNLYTLALPKMNFARPKEYYVLREKGEIILNNNNLHPHRFSSSAVKFEQTAAPTEDIQHHEELKNIAQSYPELFNESPTVKRTRYIHPKPFGHATSKAGGGSGGGGGVVGAHAGSSIVQAVGSENIPVKKPIKNKYLLASDVSHVQFHGMGTSYEF